MTAATDGVTTEQVHRSVRAGARWVVISQAFLQVTQLITSVALARILTPSVFGTFAVVTLVVLFTETVFLNLGTNAALMQRKDVNNELVSTVFWFNQITGASAAAVVLATAPLLARLLGNESATGVLRFTSLIFVLSALGGVPRVMLRRRIQSSSLALANTVNGATQAIGSVGLAALGMGVWGLAVANVASTAIGVSILWWKSRWKPQRVFQRSELRTLRRFSSNYMALQVVTFFYAQGDRIVAGQFGARDLGLYQQPTRLMMYPARFITALSADVMLPAMARLQDDRASLRSTYLRWVTTVVALLMPPLLTVAALAPSFVPAVLGDAWLDAVPLMSLLAPAWMLASIAQTAGPLAQACGRPDRTLRFSFVSTAVTIAGYLIGAFWGIEGVAAGFLTAMVLMTLPSLNVSFKLIELPMRRFLRNQAPFAAAAASMVGVELTIQYFMDEGPTIVFAVAAAAGLLTYALVLLILRPPLVRSVLSSRGRRRGRAGRAAAPTAETGPQEKPD